MKKIITVLVLAAMLLTTLAISAMAESYMEKPTCEYEVTVKKADPAVVKKDGIIDLENGEYIKADVPFEELSVNFRNADVYTASDAMAHTMEYYFSWDETHGFNFAVKYFAKGSYGDTEYDGYYTNIPAGTGSEDPEVPQDMFLSNIGLNFASGVHPETEGWSMLYHAIGKTFDGTYLEGWYQQRGNSGAYDPVGGQDFEVAYPGDGSVIFEWSIPFSEFIDVSPVAGTVFGFTICATAGIDTADAPNTTCWSVSLGQKGGWMVTYSDENTYATATLSDEPVKVNAPVVENTTTTPDAPVTTTTTTPPPATTPAPTQPATTAIESVEVEVTDGDGNVVTDTDGNAVTEVITTIITEPPTQSAGGNAGGSPVTGDPMIIAAVVAAISACGVVVAKKRK